MVNTRFNLIDEPWIPIADAGSASLMQVFASPDYRALGGNPVEKVALLKLILAIAQAAATPENDDDWLALGAEGLATKCQAYLTHWYDRFDLYGARPFLQMPAIRAAEIASFSMVQPDIASGNTTLLTHGQSARTINDADKAELLVTLMGFALGGKQADNKVTLSAGYAGKLKNGKPTRNSPPGPSVDSFGLLHSFLIGQSLRQTLWLNLLTKERIVDSNRFPGGVGIAPWESMPEGENDAIAQQLKQSLMGRLVPLCRFCLLANGGLHYSDGIAHGNYKDGMCDPSAALNLDKEPKALWVDPEKRPWRELSGLLSFLSEGETNGYQCLQLRMGLERCRNTADTVAIWSGGLRVSNDMGEQRPKGNQDFVESEVWFDTKTLGRWFWINLQKEVSILSKLGEQLYACTSGYFTEQKAEPSKAQVRSRLTHAASATRLFWQLCERDFQNLVDHCDQGTEQAKVRQDLRQRFADYAQRAYDRYCPNNTARQMDAWAHHRPNTRRYLRMEA